MRVAVVNLYEIDRPQYRLGDAILMRHTGYGRQAFRAIVASPQFEGSIVSEYEARLDGDDPPEPRWDVLREIVARRCRNLELPAADELVVHLRMGDVKGFRQPARTLVDDLIGRIDALDTAISRITIVTALHFGHLEVRDRLREGTLRKAFAANLAKLCAIFSLLSRAGLSARLHSHEDIDDDFCFLTAARFLVLGSGHFSATAAAVSRARCFIPPWARRGTAVDLDALIASTRDR